MVSGGLFCGMYLLEVEEAEKMETEQLKYQSE